MANQWQFAKYLYNLEGVGEIPPFVRGGKLKSFNYTNEEGGGEGKCDLGMLQVTRGMMGRMTCRRRWPCGTPADAGLSARLCQFFLRCQSTTSRCQIGLD